MGELRICRRLNPQSQVMVALIYPPENSENNFVGSLLDISQSGLAISYVSLGRTAALKKKHCKLSILKSGMTQKMINCRKIYEMEVSEQSGNSPSVKRAGFKFLRVISSSEVDSIIST